MQYARKYITVIALMLVACGSVVCQSEQWGEFRPVLREFQLYVGQLQPQHRVSPKLDKELQLTDPTALQPWLLPKYDFMNTELVGHPTIRYTVKLTCDMKRLGNLFERIIDRNNLINAYNAAKKGKLHYSEVRRIEKEPLIFIDQLHLMLITETFVPSEYIVFKRLNQNKVREIYKLPFFPDRILHHAIVQVLQPIWLDLLIRDTYSTIPGRGIHDGLRRIEQALQDTDNTQYCLKIDVSKYYPSIDHEVLRDVLRHKIKDEKLLSLLDSIIYSAPGIPIGNYISQWFGNIYLAYFDHYVKERLKVKYYFRYCDDMVFLAADKQSLWDDLSLIKSYLNNTLKLKIKDNYQIFPVVSRGIDFLGYRIYHDHTLVRKAIVKAFKSKLNSKCSPEHLQASAASYRGWFIHANSKGLIHKYFDDETKLLREAAGNS